MCKQIARLLHSGLVVVALLPLSPLAPEVTPAFSGWFAANQSSWNDAPVNQPVSQPISQPISQAGQDQPNQSDLFWTADGLAGPLGLPQTRSGGGTR